MPARTQASGLAMGSRMLPPELWPLARVVVVVDAACSTAARSIMTAFSFGDGVVAVRAARPAPAQAAGRQHQAAPCPVTPDGFHGVLRTGGGEAARRHTPGTDQLIGPDEGGDQTGGQPGPDHPGRVGMSGVQVAHGLWKDLVIRHTRSPRWA